MSQGILIHAPLRETRDLTRFVLFPSLILFYSRAMTWESHGRLPDDPIFIFLHTMRPIYNGYLKFYHSLATVPFLVAILCPSQLNLLVPQLPHHNPTNRHPGLWSVEPRLGMKRLCNGWKVSTIFIFISILDFET